MPGGSGNEFTLWGDLPSRRLHGAQIVGINTFWWMCGAAKESVNKIISLVEEWAPNRAAVKNKKACIWWFKVALNQISSSISCAASLTSHYFAKLTSKALITRPNGSTKRNYLLNYLKLTVNHQIWLILLTGAGKKSVLIWSLRSTDVGVSCLLSAGNDSGWAKV